jgi:hypothetical protein
MQWLDAELADAAEKGSSTGETSCFSGFELIWKVLF